MKVNMKVSEHEVHIQFQHRASSSRRQDEPAVEVVAQRIVDGRCRLGEGILYDPRISSVLWTDIYGKRLHRLHIQDESTTIQDQKTTIKAIHSTYALPKQLCSFGLLETTTRPSPRRDDDESHEQPPPPWSSPLTFLCAWEDGFSVYDVENERQASDPSRGPNVRPNGGATRLNDGRVDPFGSRFVCGGFFGERPENYEKVFAVFQRPEDGAMFHTAIVDKIQTTNSITWTLDGARMFLADSVTKTIWTHAYEPESSRLSDGRVLYQYAEQEPFVPDGSCVDADGYLWNAVWSHAGDAPGRVHRIHPVTGQVVMVVRVPDAVSQVSCCCFGGRDLDVLFITTARDGTDPTSQPHAGALYAVKLPYRGRPESRFKYRFVGSTGDVISTPSQGSSSRASNAPTTDETDLVVDELDDDDDDDEDVEEDESVENETGRIPKVVVAARTHESHSGTAKARILSLVRDPRFLNVLLHMLCVLMYLIPILLHGNEHKPVLDEPHITSPENRDVNDASTTLATIFTNDYWGRPMSSPSSHKSWRPLTVLSFRWLRGGALMRNLQAHRVVNVLAHATVAELVGILATKLTLQEAPLVKTLAKLAFALHPTHVEVINAANRPHLLAVLCSCLLCDPQISIWIFLTALACGYLAAETFLFQVVPAAVTMWCIAYIKTYHGPSQVRRRPKRFVAQAISVLPLARVLLLGGSSVLYYLLRYHLDWLSIPEGLIRPAENPFYTLQGWHRVRNYCYVVAIHVAKSWDVDFIGFSHEYGYECIPTINDWKDDRLWVPASILFLYAAIFLYLSYKQRRQSVLSVPFVLFLFHASWMVTLFPISGIVKVGTFIADRIVVASTVSTSLLLGVLAAQWVEPGWMQRKKNQRVYYRLVALLVVAAFMWRRIHFRTVEWMDPKSLLESSFRTCPRFAKAHLEASKIYSGLYPEFLNLTHSRWHLEQVESIDPDFCDVHQQFAHVAIQENSIVEFEERLSRALTCPFTLGGSMPLWNRYWTIALNAETQPPRVVREARERYQRYMQELNRAIEASATSNQQDEPKSASPLVGWKLEQ